MNDRSGYYELIGTEHGDGTLLAAIISKPVELVLWMTSAHDFSRGLLDSLDVRPLDIWQVETVRAAFAAIKEVSGDLDLIVLDSLGGLRASHPGANHVAPEVKRSISGWDPGCPVLVVNQWRHPCPPGGVYWRQVCNTRRLYNYYIDPLLSIFLEKSDPMECRWVTWYRDRLPEFRCLSMEEGLIVPDKSPVQVGKLKPWLI